MNRSLQQLTKRSSFESLLAEVSSRFTNIPAQHVGRKIEESLRLICNSLAVDESTMFLRQPDHYGTFVLTYFIRSPDLPPLPTSQFTASENFPWCSKRLIANRIICLSDTGNAPPEADIDKATWTKYRIYSTLMIPLSTGGRRPEGFWTIDSTSGKRDWPRSLQKRLKIIAEVFANALERAESERELHANEQRLQLAANTTGAGFWTLDLATGLICTTDKLKELFGLKPDDPTNLTRLFEIVHPEDRELVKKAIEAIRPGHEEIAEFRIVPAPGEIRWVMTRGSQYEQIRGDGSLLMGIALDVTERRMMEEELRTVSGRLLEAQEVERKRIARELHDGINQRVAMISTGLHQLRTANEISISERSTMINQLEKETRDVIKEIQALSYELHSPSLEYLGLAPAIASFCRELRERHGVEIVFTHKDVPKSLRPDLTIALFRITQEALHNALKYSGENYFEVQLHATRTQVSLTIRDFGVGFDVNKATQSRGLGLISMRERVFALKGSISIHSHAGEGTEVSVRVPIEMAEAATATYRQLSKPPQPVSDQPKDYGTARAPWWSDTESKPSSAHKVKV